MGLSTQTIGSDIKPREVERFSRVFHHEEGNQESVDFFPELFEKALAACIKTGKDIGSKGSLNFKVDYDLNGRTNFELTSTGSVDTQAYLALLSRFASGASKASGTFLDELINL